MFRSAALAVFVVLMVASTLVCAQVAPTSSPPVESEKVIIRTYDLSDLFRAARHYPLPANMIPATGLPGDEPSRGGESQSLFGGRTTPEVQYVADPPTPQSIAQLIISTVAPESWRDNGDAIGNAKFIGTRLVVSQTLANHKQIEDLLNGIREEGGMSYMVSVRAYWVHFTPDDLRAIAGKGAGDATAASSALKEVPDALLSDDKIYSRGQTLGYNGQTVHVASGRANTIITGMEPVVGTQAVGYQLQTAVVRSGVALQVTPQVLSDGKLVSLDLHSIVSEITDAVGLPDPRPIGGGVSGRGPTTAPVEQLLGQRARIVGQEFSTTARIPVGKKVLIGGMTFDPAATAEGVKQLYLVVEASAMK